VFANASLRHLSQSHRFLVILGHMSMGFSKVIGLSSHAAPEYLYEGGREVPYPLAPARHAPQTLIFEHGMGAIKALEQAPLGQYLNLPGQEGQGPAAGTVLIQGSRQIIGFTSIMPIRWEIGNLDAAGGDVLIHRLEIVHGGLYYV
jgi:hypothetical protein